MREWFFSRYESPDECCPYESREGGYQWIWGAPAEPHDALSDEFGHFLADELIKSLAEELEEISYEWSPAPEYESDEDYVRAIGLIGDPFENLSLALDGIEKVARRAPQDSTEERAALNLSLVGLVSALEAFFSDAFKKELFDDEECLRRFVESNPEFRKRKLPASEIFKRREALPQEVQLYLADFLWHKIASVKEMYESTFRISFPAFFPLLEDAVQKRHGIAHRGGRTVDDKTIEVDVGYIENLLELARSRSSELRQALQLRCY